MAKRGRKAPSHSAWEQRTTRKRTWRDGQTAEDLAKWDLGDMQAEAVRGPDLNYMADPPPYRHRATRAGYS